MALQFNWDEAKAESNLRKHGVSFNEAVSVFTDPLSLTVSDQEHSSREQRFIDIGASERNRIILVVYAERGNVMRIISAREATARERRQYEEG